MGALGKKQANELKEILNRIKESGRPRITIDEFHDICRKINIIEGYQRKEMVKYVIAIGLMHFSDSGLLIFNEDEKNESNMP